MRLYLIRHGAALDTAGRCIGHYDVALSPEGAHAIERAGEWVSRRPDRLLTSDLARARESAQVLARRWSLNPAYDSRLREMHFGDWEGVPWSELALHDAARLTAWMEDWVRVRVPTGESFEDVVARARGWFAEALSAWPDETLVVVAHAGVIRAILCIWLALPLEWAFKLRIEPASVSLLDTHDGS